MNYDLYEMILGYGYQPQYTRNTLYLNDHPKGMREVGQMAGVFATDWSWSSLFADFDNDGQKELYISNGYRKDVTDLDYQMYQSSMNRMGSFEERYKRAVTMVEELPGVQLSNYFYESDGLIFSDQTTQSGLSYPSYSNGTAYADFDLDGDLDLIINNIDQHAFLFRNNTNTKNFLKIYLKGSESNPGGIGAKIFIKHSDNTQFHQHYLSRGYQSSVDPAIYFGLGNDSIINELKIRWPDGKIQSMNNISAGKILTLNHENASRKAEARLSPKTNTLLETRIELGYKHEEDDFIDFKYFPLLPGKYSHEGPCIKSADLNNDHFDDLIIAGAKGFGSIVFFQDKEGKFKSYELPGSKDYETLDIEIFDFEMDGDKDIYLANGGSHLKSRDSLNRDLIYLNTGNGIFIQHKDFKPNASASSKSVAEDFDKDGDVDLFLGGHFNPDFFPHGSGNHLLINNNGKLLPEPFPLPDSAGIVKDAVWTDINADSWPDLVIVGEWMSPKIFLNKNGKFIHSASSLDTLVGWWNTISSLDINNDGYPDFVAGNLGLNSQLKASKEYPVSLYSADFDGNRTIDPVMSYYALGKEYALPPRDAMIDQMNRFEILFPRYKPYARAEMKNIFSKVQMAKANIYRATNFAHMVFINNGKGDFIVKELPIKSQISPVKDIHSDDLNNDGYTDLIIVGNFYHTENIIGRYDAGRGMILLNDGNSGFMADPNNGININKDMRSIASFSWKGKKTYVVASNEDSLVYYTQP